MSKLIVFYSGRDGVSEPEVILGDRANVMLTYALATRTNGKPAVRFRRILKARRRKQCPPKQSPGSKSKK